MFSKNRKGTNDRHRKVMNTAPRQIPELTEQDKARFWAKVEKRTDGIWNWVGKRRGRPTYGTFKLKGEAFYAHRIAWVLREREVGKPGVIPEGLSVLHKNDVTIDLYDVNPDNLWLGTQGDNVRDAVSKGRHNDISEIGAIILSETAPLRRGIGNHKAKLKESDIAAIRESKKQWVSLIAIAAVFGVSRYTIDDVISRRTWSHV